MNLGTPDVGRSYTCLLCHCESDNVKRIRTVAPKSFTMDPISTKSSTSPYFCANRSETNTAAAAPSDVGKHLSLVRGMCTFGDCLIWSSLRIID